MGSGGAASKAVRQAGKGILLAAGYFAAYFLAWYASQDQWFLPAGLRAAALLFLPFRLWPYVFLADASALLVTRLPQADKYTPIWAAVSPLILMPAWSLAPLLFRRAIRDTGRFDRWQPVIAAALASWAWAVNMALNASLGGPRWNTDFHTISKFVVGNYLGILLIVLPVLLWLRRESIQPAPSRLPRHLTIAVAAIAALHVGALSAQQLQPEVRQSLLMLMILPAVGLTFLHGWKGAALGTIVVNVGIAVSMPNPGAAGAHDQQAFIAQQGLAITATTLLVLGSIISHHFRRARLLGLAEEQALQLARSNVLANEQQLRQRAEQITQIHTYVSANRREIVYWLREHGHHSAALQLTSAGVVHSRLFDSHIAALYPVGIEVEGLYVVLQSEALLGALGSDAEPKLLLRGNPRMLSIDLQIAAYRCVYDAVLSLSRRTTARVSVRGRCGATQLHRGITLVFSLAEYTRELDDESFSAIQSLLAGRVGVYGGKVVTRRRRIVVLMTEPISETEPHEFGSQFGVRA